MEIVTCTEDGSAVEHRDYTPFGSAALAEFAAGHGADVPLRISSHCGTFRVDGFGYDPHERVITLSHGCPHNLPFWAASYRGDPEGTARVHHREAEKVARHLEEEAARFRAKFPAPAELPPGMAPSPLLPPWPLVRGKLARAVRDGAPPGQVDELRRTYRAARAAQGLRDLLASDLPPTAEQRRELAAILLEGLPAPA